VRGANRRRVQALQILSRVGSEPSLPINLAEISQIAVKIGSLQFANSLQLKALRQFVLQFYLSQDAPTN
jgi:hypothetical protein